MPFLLITLESGCFLFYAYMSFGSAAASSTRNGLMALIEAASRAGGEGRTGYG